MDNKETIQEWTSRFNANMRDSQLRVNTKEIHEYIKSENKSVKDLDQKEVINWIQDGGLRGLKGFRQRKFNFFVYKTKISICKKDELALHQDSFYWRFLCFIPNENGKDKEYVYYSLDEQERRTFFNERILFDKFINLDLDSCGNKRDSFFRLKPIIENYGLFISPTENKTRSDRSVLFSGDFIERLVFEQRMIKTLLKIREKYGREDFFKNLKEPHTKSDTKYWKWWWDFGCYLQYIPDKRFFEYSTFRPVNSLILQTRNNRQTKYIYDFFPYLINLIYKYFLSDEFIGWQTCNYCGVYFKKDRKDQACCSPNHSKLARNKKYKQNK